MALAGRRVLERAAVVVATTAAERAIVRATCAPGPHRRSDARPGSTPLAETSRAVRPDNGGDPPLNVLYLGRLHPHKGLHLVVRALGAARGEGLKAELTVAGTGRRRYQRFVSALVEELNLTGRVRFLGHVDGAQRSTLLEKTDVFVLPSRSENFGYAAAEAMAAGIPVVLGEHVGLAELVERRQCGRIVPVADVDALRAALQLYADPALRREHGRRAHEAVRDACTNEQMGAAMETIYRDIAGTPGQC
jgi:glycosyltransferase involved in cell wall biosynthesis